MKHTKKKRVLALVLCMILVLSTGIAAFANENVGLQSVACQATTLERMIKNAAGEDVGTLIADIPEGAFQASSSNANIQMDVQADTGEEAVLNRVQQQLEAEGTSGYTVQNYVMSDVTFYVNGEKQIPQKPITFTMRGTNVDTEHARAFADDRQNATQLMDVTSDENGGLQFTADASDSETIVYGVFDGTASEAEAEESTDTFNAENIAPLALAAGDYTITTSNPSGINITVQHYLNGKSDSPLYKDSVIHLNNNEKITNLGTLANYEVVRVVPVDENNIESAQISGSVVLSSDQTYRVYYQATKEQITGKPVQMFDYTINTLNGGINSSSNYGTNIPTTSRLASGTTNDGCNNYDTKISVSGKKPYYINTWDYDSARNEVNRETVNNTSHIYGSNKNGTAFAAKGIITGIEYESGALKMGVTSDGKQLYEPGYFTKTAKTGKNIYLNDYKLTFNREGDTYTLYDVTDNNNTSKLTGYNRETGANFFPLDGLGTSDAQNTKVNDAGSVHNDYFGMRYDVEFSLGDYLGDLNYHFKGDDDLWVVLDAEKNGGQVVLDIGGIHAAIEDSVDLWKVLLGKDNYTLDDKKAYLEADSDNNGILNKNEKHTLTILYMERGANESNCKMDFTLPNSTVVDTSQLSTSDLKLTKVNTSNVGIANAVFTLTNANDDTDVQNVTSDANGKITFTGLKENSTYTLTEAEVPSPYVRSDTSWQIKMEGNPLRAVLYDSTGTTPQEKATDGTYHIVNSSQEEIVSGSVESSKTVTVDNYDQRTYDVNLTASSKVTQTTTKTTPYDIVMVLDTSGSMKDKFYQYTPYTGNLDSKGEYYIRNSDKIYQEIKYQSSKNDPYWYYLNDKSKEVRVSTDTETIYTRSLDTSANSKNEALKAAAKAFVDNVYEKNKDSRIGIVTFASSAKIMTSYQKEMLRVGDSYSTIVEQWIDGLGKSGATNTADGFDKAITIFSDENTSKWANVQQTDGRKKMVVFLTDGVPTTQTNYDSTVASNTLTKATEIKDSYKAEIYSLGIFDAAGTNGKLNNADHTIISDFMKNVASSENHYMTADSVSSLFNLFNSITENLDVSITATITDVIDSRFELVQGEKERLQATGATVTTNDDGSTTVTWADTTVKNQKNNVPGWQQTIKIKAKDDFIGGNMIPTNGSASGITVDGNTKLFPQPSVNVKLLTPAIGNKEITYYKGDEIESENFSGELLETYKIMELDNKTTLTFGKGIPGLTEDQLNNLKAGNVVEVPYSYTNSGTDIEGVFRYEFKNTKYDHEGTAQNPLRNHPATKVGQDVEDYELTVTFIPKTVAERKDLLKNTAVLEPNSDATISGTVVTADDMTVTGIYKVHVLALWTIVKESTSTDTNGKHPRLSGAEFELVKDNGEGYIGKSNENGFVEWYKDNKKVSFQEIEKATYTLRETKAPAGYAKSDIEWTIEITDTEINVTDSAGRKISANTLQYDGKTYDTYVYENTPVYELPSTGGPGIYLFTIGGMLLMGAAAWILYKKKCREVLKR